MPNTHATGPKRQQYRSKDRLWRSSAQMPHLLQCVSNGNYYGRIKVEGKILRQSFQTTSWTAEQENSRFRRSR